MLVPPENYQSFRRPVYHYGAVGGALILGPVVTALVGTVESDVLVVVGAGGVATLVLFAVLAYLLPK